MSHLGEEKMKVGSFAGSIAILFMATLSAVAQNTGTVKLFYSASLSGKQVAAGEYKVVWETHSAAAIETLTQKKEGVATVQGKWVDRDTKYEANSVVYSNNPDGSRSVLEIRFAGRKGALVFDEEAARSQLLPRTSTMASTSVTLSPLVRKIRYVGKPRVAPQTETLDPVDSMWWRSTLMQQKQPMLRYRR
jgi:hypothetical protein